MGEIKGSESRCCDLGGLQFVGGLVNVNVNVKVKVKVKEREKSNTEKICIAILLGCSHTNFVNAFVNV
jgi:hypothetical protein